MAASDYLDPTADDDGLARRLGRLARVLDVHLLLSTIALLLAGLLLSYVVQSTRHAQFQKELRIMTAPLLTVTSDLRKAILQLDAPASEADDVPLARADALAQVTRAAELAGVKLVGVAAPDASAHILRLTVLGTYTALLHFVAEAEATGATVENVKLEKATNSDKSTVLSTDLSFRTGADRQRANPILLDQIVRLPRADPFRPVSGLSGHPSFAGAVDLSAEHQLTAITTIGAVSFATIDGRDYRPGDRLGHYIVFSVGALVVELRNETHPGQRYVLALRATAPIGSATPR